MEAHARKHSSKPCWFDHNRTPAYIGSHGIVVRSPESHQGGSFQCRKRQPRRKLLEQDGAAEHLLQRLANFRPQKLTRPSAASINCSAISVVFPISRDCWLIYHMPVIKLLQPKNLQPQKTKLSLMEKKMSLKLSMNCKTKSVLSQTGTWASTNNKIQAYQIFFYMLLYALQCELKMRFFMLSSELLVA